MAWSLEGVLRCVLSNPEKARRFFDPSDLPDLRATLTEALRRSDARRALEAAALLVVVDPDPRGAIEVLVREPATLARLLPALPVGTRDAVLAALGDRVGGLIPSVNALEPGLRAVVVRALVPACLPTGALSLTAALSALYGMPDAEPLLAAALADRPLSLDEQLAVLANLPRPMPSAWLPRVASLLAAHPDHAACFAPADQATIARMVAETVAVTGTDTEAFGWLQEAAPALADALLQAELSADAGFAVAPPDPERQRRWLDRAFPGGVDRAAVEARFGRCTADDGLAALLRESRIAVSGSSWGCAPAGQPFGALPHAWADLAVALHVARTLSTMADAAGLTLESEASAPWRPFVGWAPGADGPVPALRRLLGLRRGMLFEGRELLSPDVQAAPLRALLEAATAAPERVELSEDLAVAPSFVVGRVGPYLAGLWGERVWT